MDKLFTTVAFARLLVPAHTGDCLTWLWYFAGIIDFSLSCSSTSIFYQTSYLGLSREALMGSTTYIQLF